MFTKFWTFIITLASLFALMSGASAAPVSNGDKDCGACHACATPTQSDPCLKLCPRSHAADLGKSMHSPESVILDDLEADYKPVHFQHRLHAGMTEMDKGCQDCHHFQEVGGITACKNCHPADAADENLDQPSLKGAYHRQCLGCHQEWSHDTSCEVCHLKKGAEPTEAQTKTGPGSKYAGLNEPVKKVWNSTYGGGTVVTLHHRNHTEKYGVECAACHHAEGCAVCHAKKEQTTQVRHSEEALHSICNTCHAEMSCDQCHLKSEAPEFSHIRTGWPLKVYHERLSCKRCHGSSHHFTKPTPECSSCHKPWDAATFKHEHTGLALNETHAGTECSECHADGNFAIAPSCSNCHDTDIAFPASLPGNRTR